MDIDVDGNGTKIEIEDERGKKLKHEHRAAMVNLSVQTTQFDKNTQDKRELVARMEQKVDGNNGNTCKHNDEGMLKRLSKKLSKETHQS